MKTLQEILSDIEMQMCLGIEPNIPTSLSDKEKRANVDELFYNHPVIMVFGGRGKCRTERHSISSLPIKTKIIISSDEEVCWLDCDLFFNSNKLRDTTIIERTKHTGDMWHERGKIAESLFDFEYALDNYSPGENEWSKQEVLLMQTSQAMTGSLEERKCRLEHG